MNQQEQKQHSRNTFIHVMQKVAAFIVAIILCLMITVVISGCKKQTDETVVVKSNTELQKDSSKNVLDTYDKVDIKNITDVQSWYCFDSMLAYIRIIDFDTLGRPVRTIDAELQRGTAITNKRTTDSASVTHEQKVLKDSTSTAITQNNNYEEKSTKKIKVPWWKQRCFYIAIITMSVIIAIWIAYRSRNKWWNYIVSWILHIK